MELAFLVYLVNNLTYNGSFLFYLGLCPLILWFVCYIGSIFYKGLQYNDELVLEKEYELEKDFEGFKAGDKVILTDIYKYVGNVAIKSTSGIYHIAVVSTDGFVNSVKFDTITITKFIKPRKSWFVVGMFLLTLHTLLPNKQTTIYCVSAYLVQTVLTDSRTQELGTAAYEATLTQLKEWGKQSDDVAKLIKPLVEKAINEKVNPTTTANK